MVVNWIRILEEISNEVYTSVKPLMGTEKSRETVGIGASGDLTREIDIIAEEVIIDYLERNHISCILVSEECGVRRIGKSPKTYVIVDSVDGTTNAMRGNKLRFNLNSYLTDEQLTRDRGCDSYETR